MSAIKKVKTVFKNLDGLKKALIEAGVKPDAIEVDSTLTNKLPQTLFGGRTVSNALSVRIRKDVTGGYEDAGFRYADGVFEAVLSTHDGYGNFGDGSLLKTTVRYNVIEAKRLAKLKGYTVTERTADDGTIELVCNYAKYTVS